MSKLALIAIVFMAFCILCVVVLLSGKKPVGSGKAINLKLEPDTTIKLFGEDKFIRVEYSSYEDAPSARELFPDLVSEITSQEDDLDSDFWMEYAKFDSLSTERKLALCLKLAEHGWMERDAIESFTIPAPKDEDGNPIELAPDPADEEAYDSFWNRPFAGEGSLAGAN